jgi:predicted MFS family arabinose efflux permease
MADVPSAGPGYRRYAPVWSVRPVRWAFTGTLIGRMAQTMIPLTLLLLFRQRTGSFAAAGLAVAVFGTAFAAAGPVTARLADRHGSRVLAGAGAVSAASLVLLAVAASPAWSWTAVVIAGMSTPPLTSALRAEIVARLVAERDRAAAFSLDAVATELLFVTGPVAVAAAVALGRTTDAVFAAAGLVLAGSAFVTLAAGRSVPRPAPAAVPDRQGNRPAARLAPWLVIAAAQMAAIGFVEVAVTARVIQLGHPASAGTVLAVWAAGSVAGGLVYGSRDWPGRAASQLRVLLLLMAGGFAVIAVARDMAWLYPLMLAAGLSTAPAAAALTASFSTAGATAAQAGSFAWLASCSSLSGSAGYAAAGLLLTHATITATILAGAALPVAAATAVPRSRRQEQPAGDAGRRPDHGHVRDGPYAWAGQGCKPYRRPHR